MFTQVQSGTNPEKSDNRKLKENPDYYRVILFIVNDWLWPQAAVFDITVLTSTLERKAAIKVVSFSRMLGSANGQLQP